TGGFTDCLLQYGARSVACVDTAYGQLAYKLRTDERITIFERSNALHLEPPNPNALDLVVMDLGWTVQRLAIPAAIRWLKPGAHIISLIKPHYEAKELDRENEIIEGVLPEEAADEISRITFDNMHTLSVEPIGLTKSPILGGGKRGKKKGNLEHLAFLRLPA
ncbi:MAG: SAM-dependent methyltransferase, partial [Planctomycetota bacterium]